MSDVDAVICVLFVQILVVSQLIDEVINLLFNDLQSLKSQTINSHHGVEHNVAVKDI